MKSSTHNIVANTLEAIKESSRAQWGIYFLFLLITGFVHLWDARLFTWYNDDFDFLDHISKLEGDFWYLFSPEHHSSGRATTTLFLIFLRAVWGEEQMPYHLALIFVHLCAVWTLAWSLSRIGFEKVLSMITGLLFLFCVSHYEVPYWLSCFAYIGCMTFGCLGIVQYTQYTRGGNRKNLGYTCALFLASACFHAGAVIFAVLGAYFAFRLGNSLRATLKSCWLPILLCLGLSTLIFTIYPGHAQNRNVSQIHNISHLAQVTSAYLGRTFQSPYWVTTAVVNGPSHLDTLAGGLLIATAAILLVYRRCTPLDAIVWSALALPLFGGSPLTEYRSRYFYFSSVGPALLTGWALLKAGEWAYHTMGRKTRWILPGIGLVAIITVSHLQQDKTESIFRANIGRYYLAAGVSLELGIQFLRDGILGAPEHLGQVFYVRYGETAWFSGISTEDVLEKGMEVFPGDTEIALLHEVSGYISSSRTLPSDYIERVRRTNPQTTNSIGTALNNAGSYHYNRGDYRLAEQLYASAIRVDPGYLGAIVKFANALLHQGELGDAIIAFDRFFELNKGTFGDAIPGLRFFVETEPHNLRARSHLARAYASVANLAEAEKHIYVGLELAGDNEDFIEECVEIAEMIRKTGDIEAANAIHQRIHQP